MRISHRQRLLAGTVLGVLLVAALVLLGLRSGGTAPRVDALPDAVDPTSESAPPPILGGRPPIAAGRGDAAQAPRRTVPVEIVAVTPEGLALPAVVYSGPSFASIERTHRVTTGAPTVVEVPTTHTHWQALLERGGGGTREYESHELGQAEVAALAARTTIRITIPRAKSSIRVTAHDWSGRPVPLVVVELAGASRPADTRRTTDETGSAVWTDVRSDYVRPDGLRVQELPEGYSLLKDPVLEVTRREGSSWAEGVADLLVDRCTAGVTARVRDVTVASVLLERWEAGAWTRATPHGWAHFDPDVPSPPHEEPAFVDALSPRPGQLRVEGLCPGKYRITLFGVGGGLHEAIVELSAGEVRDPLEFTPVPSVPMEGRLVGPASGVARRADLRLVDGDAAADRFRGLVLGLGLSADGTFRVDLPRGVLRFTVSGTGTGDRPYVILPAVLAVRGEVQIASVAPVVATGRIVDKDGKPCGGVSVSAGAEPVDAAGRPVEVLWHLFVGRTRTSEDGRWALGPGMPGLWYVRIALPSGGEVLRRIPVSEGRDVGPIVLDADR